MTEVVTPKKTVRSSFSSGKKCAVCGTFLDDPRKRVKLKKELALKLQEIVASENLDPEGYLCNNNCYKSVNRYFELKAALKSLKTDLTQKFENVQGQSACVRWKRELPSDVSENENSSAKASRPTSLLSKSSSLHFGGPVLSYPVIPRIIRQGLFLQPVSRFLQQTGTFPLQPLPIPRGSVASRNVASSSANSTTPTSINPDFQSEDSPVCKVEVRTLFFLAVRKGLLGGHFVIRQQREYNCLTCWLNTRSHG